MNTESRRRVANPDSPIQFAKLSHREEERHPLVETGLRLRLSHLPLTAFIIEQLYLHETSPIDLGPALAANDIENINR